jgi:hypothetical protein
MMSLKMSLAAGIAAVLVLFCVGAARAQDFPGIDELKVDAGFSAWPGKGGPLKRGLNFQPSDYPILSGFVIAGSELVVDFRNLGIVRIIRLERGSEAIDLLIGVASGSTDNGQELFLRSTIAQREAPFLDSLQRGDSIGITIGDLNFVPLSATASDVMGVVYFIRNNVFCGLIDGRPDAPTTVDMKALAAAIDARIQTMPDLSSSGFNSLRPVISEFSPVMSSLPAREGASTTLNVVISNPPDPATGMPEPFTRLFFSDGNFTIEDTGTVVTVRPSDALGTLPIELLAINASLQFSTQTTSITVTP